MLYLVIHLFVPCYKAQQRLAGSNLEGMDSKSWKSVVLPKIYEEKMHKLEGELEKKVWIRFIFEINRKIKTIMFVRTHPVVILSVHQKQDATMEENCMLYQTYFLQLEFLGFFFKKNTFNYALFL